MTLTEHDARRLFAAATVARLATVTEAGRPHLVPVTFAVDGDPIYIAVDAKPKTTATCGGCATSGPTRSAPCWPTTTTRTGPRCGGFAPTGSAVIGRPARDGRARSRCSPGATRSTVTCRRPGR